MITDLLWQIALGAIGAAVLSAIALLGRSLVLRDPRTRERWLACFAVAVFAAPLLQAGAIRLLPYSWRPAVGVGVGDVPGAVRTSQLPRGAQSVGPAHVRHADPPSALEPRESPSFPVPWGAVALGCYVLGVLICVGRLILRAYAAAALVRRATPVSDARVLRAWAAATASAAPSTFPILESVEIASPACAGLSRAVVLVPAGCADAAGHEDLHAALRHELAHARRNDPLRFFAEGVLVSLHWFNPLVHALVRTLRGDRESARDAEAAGSPAQALVYAGALIRFAELARSARSPAAVASFVSARSIQRRLGVMTTLDLSSPPRRPWLAPTVAAALGLGVATLHAAACASLTAEPPRSIGPARVSTFTDGNGTVRRAEISAPTEPRDMRGVLSSLNIDPAHFKPEDFPVAGSLTEQETVVELRGTAEAGLERTPRTFRAEELRLGLPEGSSLTLSIEGSEIRFSDLSELTRITVRDPRVIVRDKEGVERIRLGPIEAGTVFTIVGRPDLGEANLQVLAHRNDAPVPIGVSIDMQTGTPAGEQQPPPGAVRWAVLEPGERTRSFRLKMQWIHDGQTIAAALHAMEEHKNGR